MLKKEDKNFPLISIIVPVYNVRNYVSCCVQSIANQTYKNLEIILVDDGSTDGSGKICDMYAKEDPRIIIYHKENGGLSDARNYGLENAHGDYIGFVDGDDCIHPQMYDILYKIIQRLNCKVSVCDFDRPEHIEKEAVLLDYGYIERISRNKAVAIPEITKVSACNKLYKKEIFNGIRYPVGKLHEDEYVFHKVMWKCEEGIAVTDKKLYHYIVRNTSIMGTMSRKRIDNALEALENRILFAKEKKWNKVLHELKDGYLDYCANTYIAIKNGSYGASHLECLDVLYNAEKSMIEKYADIKARKKYVVFRENPSEYERKYYNKQPSLLSRFFFKLLTHHKRMSTLLWNHVK